MKEKKYVETHCNTSLRNTKSAYTLIELMVVIAIIAIMTIMTYVPYSFYSNKEKVRITAKEVSQSLWEARNMAINGLSNLNSNVQIGLYFDKNFWNKVRYLSYPYDFSGTYITNEDISKNIRLIKDKTLPDSVNITSINDKENMLLIFHSISWSLDTKYYDGTSFKTYSSWWINVNFWFKWVVSWPLSKIVKYNTKTFITDY